jgi:hypothetical protein
VGNRAACQPQSRSLVKGLLKFWVASSSRLTSSSILRSTGKPADGKPSRRATDKRTERASSSSPSIDEVVRASSISSSAWACCSSCRPRPATRLSSLPCCRRHSPSSPSRAEVSHVKLGQSLCCQRYWVMESLRQSLQICMRLLYHSRLSMQTDKNKINVQCGFGGRSVLALAGPFLSRLPGQI